MFKVSLEIKEQLKKLPDTSGVYMMFDKFDNVIYIGKAKNLKNRVSSYFNAVDSHTNKTKALVVNINRFEYIITSSEKEALVLEANLIKEKKPKFNILLKDDKSYPYIAVTKERFPQIFKTRDITKDYNYFGPYTSVNSVNKFIELIIEIYPYIKCDYSIQKIKQVKMYYELIKDDYTEEDYKNTIDEIISFLNGNTGVLKQNLVIKRDEYAKNLDFENAIDIREKIKALDDLKVCQRVSSLNSDDKDYIALKALNDYMCVSIFIYRNGMMIDRENHIIDNVLEKDESDILGSFIIQYYKDSNFIPKNIYVNFEINDGIADILSNIKLKKIKVIYPKRARNKEIINMVEVNSYEYLTKFYGKIKKQQQKKEEINVILKSIVCRENVNRIEAFDISNIFGALSVGSMVVFENTLKKPTDYRMFKIKHVKGADDYASMREVVSRRLNRLRQSDFGKRADIIILDGGKGHVSTVNTLLRELKIDIPIIGLIKDDKHTTKSLYYDGKEVLLEKGTLIYNFFYIIQEEMHRFAITYHKKLRTNSLASSILDGIKGIGVIRRNNLLKKFKSIDSIKIATIEELECVEKMDLKSAKSVYDYFRED